ncbi:Mur ligase family protein [Neorickettsia sennetsu]|uniref:UDP-N-acetylmuramoyl-tripeptide--D-alanyl-D-alanine ligase, truncation n=1 Tax=Ehrlichia sennetsu (strain ATCC VR-367 / Miyayama) TaxID=222891 RepID=Q2GDT4_EHRS3|nr:Mur ligase family protein [Neorickettsia sennetsu]ABD45740.1 UDP-N-acetylmuramoyl-tripeptide--D-alanyl-D-alanine ligase, truncation [Neorickettsia sennetsu str. Miyayama]
MLLTADLIRSILKAELICEYQAKIDISRSKFSMNCEKVGKGEIFVIADAKNHDIPCFIETAYLNGASAIITKKDIACPKIPIPIIRVDDPLRAMEKLAAILIRNYQPTVIGITGSSKTLTKNLIVTLLKNYGKTCYNEDGTGNFAGFTLGILNADFPCKFLVLEVDTTCSGNVDLFNQITLPKVGVITDIRFHQDRSIDLRELIVMEKAKIFQNGCIAVLNFDTPYTELLLQEARKNKATIISFGRNENCDVQLLSHSNNTAVVKIGRSQKTCKLLDHNQHLKYVVPPMIGVMKALKLKVTQNSLNNTLSVFQSKMELENNMITT